MDCYILNVSKRSSVETVPLETIDLVEKKQDVSDEIEKAIVEMRSKFEEICKWLTESVQQLM